MEEILASIRRIISEDDDAGRRAAEPPLELSRPAGPSIKAALPADDLMVFDEEPEIALEPEPAPVRQPVVAEAPMREAPRAPAPAPRPPAQGQGFEADVEDQIVSGVAVSAAASSFTRLAGSLRISEAPGQTVEGVIRELLRPMLKEWLDTHLPAIVEAKVEAEVERIARLSR
jgi:hypothetical protein